MINVDQYEYIRTAYRSYDKKIREIAKETGHSRNTVRKALRKEYIGYSERQNQPYPILGPYLKTIDNWLEQDKDKPKKQRHTGTRIYNRLKSEKGYTGSLSTVLHYVKTARQRIGVNSKQVFIPLEPEAGQEAEIDWGSCIAVIGGHEERLKIFCMRSKYSGKHFVRCYPCERQQAFFDAHIHGFAFFGGVFPVLIYDNLTTAVQKVLSGKKRILQEEYKKFNAYYNFNAKFCNPAKGHEKGGVEGLVGFARRNYMVPVPEASTLQELNKMLLEQCIKYGEHTIQGRDKTVKELYKEEQKYLYALPEEEFSNVQSVSVKADKYSTVMIDKNRYSVPIKYAYLKLNAVLKVSIIEIYLGNKKISKHKRLYNVNRWSLDPFHYLNLIQQRPESFSSARPLKYWRKTWPENYNKLLEKFCKSHGETNGTRKFINVLLLHKEYNAADIEAAVSKALLLNVSDSESVKQILLTSINKISPEYIPLPGWEVLPSPNVSVYDKISGGAV